MGCGPTNSCSTRGLSPIYNRSARRNLTDLTALGVSLHQSAEWRMCNLRGTASGWCFGWGICPTRPLVSPTTTLFTQTFNPIRRWHLCARWQVACELLHPLTATSPSCMPSNNGSSRKLIQLVLRDSGYVLWLRSLLLEDGRHRILLADRPDLTLAGVVVIDEDNFEGLAPVLNPERFVVIVPKGSNNISRLWDSGIRHVVFEEDSLRSAQLAIVAVEMKLATLRRREGHRVSSTKESPI